MFESLKAKSAQRQLARPFLRQLKTARRQILQAAQRAKESGVAVERPDLTRIPGPFRLSYNDPKRVDWFTAKYNGDEALWNALSSRFDGIGISCSTARNYCEYDLLIPNAELFNNVRYISVDPSKSKPLP